MARISRELIAALRNHGLRVVEVPGCWGRDNGNDAFSPAGVVAHATAGSRTASDGGELNVILNGSNTAPPPISQFMLGRGTDATVYFVADGRCNHARNGFPGTRFAGVGNGSLIGIEACNDNRGEPWHNYDVYVRLVAVVLAWHGWSVDRLVGHKEHQPGDKSDPTFNMNTFRADVARTIAELQAPVVPKGDDVATVYAAGRGWAVVDATTWRDVDDNDPILTYDEQDDANALAQIFGANFRTVSATAWDRGRAHYEKTGSVVTVSPAG
jgi:hypothetical protein